jgi:hypothetical protein
MMPAEEALIALFAPSLIVPALIMVVPVYELARGRIRVPVPVLVRDVAFDEGSLVIVGLKLVSLEPVIVRVRDAVPDVAMEPDAVNVSMPEPDESMVPSEVPRVKSLLVLTVPPVYFRTPPFSTRLAATAEEAPILLGERPSANTDTDKVPPLIVVTPV